MYDTICEKFPGKLGTPGEIPDVRSYMAKINKGQISDDSTIKGVFATNNGLKGFHYPMKKTEAGDWEIDFTNRYFMEDLASRRGCFGLSSLGSLLFLALRPLALILFSLLGFAQARVVRQRARTSGADKGSAPLDLTVAPRAALWRAAQASSASSAANCRSSGRGALRSSDRRPYSWSQGELGGWPDGPPTGQLERGVQVDLQRLRTRTEG